ncbi:penicillin-binding protein activator [Glaciimonas sp. CA11.2]|uniref:penicillin-binding protein activator n=1 Tax=Glaciimonas sp. CA11.2 TaxID=3048601 RepID=UPI002AB4059B|nr:penicillin-binding protein activator [Glaciimonas sp. CA11.2]MDY7546290.1 penicillin-binding protein activator [Glaciimonas sp. CA11.2]MEB0163063.1 penicillin-binding protein activator [Glaciimonas sp. CA11.2]
MLYKWAKPLLLVLAGVMMHGLSPAALANTTVVEQVANDIGDDHIPLASIALLLPTRSGPLGSAAEALRSGFLAAYERDKSGLAVTVIEATDTPADMLAAYLAASPHYDILVGPLSRTGMTAIVKNGQITKPTVALTQPDLSAAEETRLPPLLLPIGLSIEAEARQVADWIGVEQGPGKVFVIATAASWQRRVVSAFVQQAASAGLVTEVMTISMTQGVANAGAMDQLNQRIQTENPRAIFVALTADQASQVRTSVGPETTMYGISQLNSLNGGDSKRLAELSGVRLLDIPWLLTPENPAMRLYPRRVASEGGAHNADLERLYALGIDAFNVSRQIAKRNIAFQLRGVTGQLNIGFGVGTPAFERTEPTAAYQDGVVVPLEDR